jgi:hypothetical protein
MAEGKTPFSSFDPFSFIRESEQIAQEDAVKCHRAL